MEDRVRQNQEGRTPAGRGLLGSPGLQGCRQFLLLLRQARGQVGALLPAILAGLLAREKSASGTGFGLRAWKHDPERRTRRTRLALVG